MKIHSVGKMLYKKSSAGKTLLWNTWVEDPRDGTPVVIVTSYGQDGGKMQFDRLEITEGKNIGKSNETTPVQQAILQAESKRKGQLDAGYVKSRDEMDDVVIRPMLAHSYSGRSKDIQYPCFVQRKYDGVRCLAIPDKDTGEIQLMSRRGKYFPHLDHIKQDAKTTIAGRNVILDGELYSDELTFQQITGITRKQKLTEKDTDLMSKVYLMVYDVVDLDDMSKGFTGRYFSFMSTHTQSIRYAETPTVQDEDEMKEFHDIFVNQGYEGIIVRNYNGPYLFNKRSKDVQKFKNFMDEEFVITGYTDGVGVESGCVIWTCETKDGKKSFQVRPKGTHEDRKDWYKNADRAIGKHLTVRFQEYTDDGIPRFPVGIDIRDYE